MSVDTLADTPFTSDGCRSAASFYAKIGSDALPCGEAQTEG